MSGARPEVIVIRGGPAGLSAAIAARLKGFEVTVAEGAYPPIDKACGEGILPECVEALRRLDVDPRGEGYRFRGVRFVDRGVVVEAAFHAAFGLALRRSRLHELLVRRAGELGVRLLWGKRVHDLDRLIASAWVIAADGLNSAIRLAVGLDHGRTRQPRYGFRRRYHLSPWTNLVEVHWGARCQIYVTPVGHDEIGLALVTRDSH